jgi:outer membrane protein assembly factor BamA
MHLWETGPASSLLYNSRVSRRAVFLCFYFLCGLGLWAQTAGKAKLSYKLLSIHVKGLDHFKEDQIIAASGLHLGQFAGENDFQRAVQVLGDTGMFSNLVYSYQYSTAGCNLELQVTENDKLIPIVFDNFVWFSDQELLDLLRTRVPLFEGQLPSGGNLAEKVSSALDALLTERKIAGKTEYLQSAGLNGPIESYDYKVTFHAVVIRNAEFPGAAASEIPALQAAAKQIVGKDYLRSAMREQEKFSLMPVYLSRGYLKAKFSDSQAKVAQDGAQTLVDVSFPVTPGIQYKLAELEIAGYRVFPVEPLRDLIHLKIGEPANAIQLEEDVRAVQRLYGTKGYMEAQIHPEPTMDDGTASVRYRVNLVEGDQYHMGDLKIDGLPDDAAKRMVTQWQMKRGDPFDDSYVARFFKVMYGDASLQRSYNLIPKQAADPQSKTVSVFLHFVPKA